MPRTGRAQTQSLLQAAGDSFPHDLCRTCECFLGYIAQLRIDSEPVDKDLFLPFKIGRLGMHKCLGCDPCPPGDLYAEYVKKKVTFILL